MAKKQRNRAGLGLTALAGLVFIFMALPWLTLSCSGRDLLTQSGFQAMVGKVDSHMENLGDQGASAQQLTEKHTKEGSSAWWLAFLLLGACGAGFAGVRLFSGDAAAAKPAIAMSAVAALVLTASLLIGLPFERAIDKTKQELQSSADDEGQRKLSGIAVSLGRAMVVKREPGLWLSLGASWSQVLLAGFIHLALTRRQKS